MAIPLLDVKAQWAKIAAGFKGGKLFRNPPKRPSHPYADGFDAQAREAAQYDVGMGMQKSVFGGKSFSQRSK